MADRAENRYQAQINQTHLACLDDLNDLVVETHFYEWKMYEAASRYDFDLASDYEDEFFIALDKAIAEYDQLEAKYDW